MRPSPHQSASSGSDSEDAGSSSDVSMQDSVQAWQEWMTDSSGADEGESGHGSDDGNCSPTLLMSYGSDIKSESDHVSETDSSDFGDFGASVTTGPTQKLIERVKFIGRKCS